MSASGSSTQHQRMIQMMRELNEAMLQGKGKEALSGILAGLHQYTKIHFSAEERLFAEHGYADAEKHRMQHDYFIGKIDEFKPRSRRRKTGHTCESVALPQRLVSESHQGN